MIKIPVPYRLLLLTVLLLPIAASAKPSYSIYADQTYPMNVYWGDTHLHTNMSFDANGMGNKRLTPDDAYRFAKGEVIVAHNGQKAKLRRPLDFLVVADHAEGMGAIPLLQAKNPEALKTEWGQRAYKKMLEYPLRTNDLLSGKFTEYRNKFIRSVLDKNNYGFWLELPDHMNENLRKTVWEAVASRADHYNEPGKFTAFSGYEWSGSWTPSGQLGNLHRVVIFKDNAKKVGKILPFSRADSINPESLWEYMSDYEKTAGGEVLAIPHNGNLSGGEMFAVQTLDRKPIDRQYALMRSRWEPLYEVTQMKGDGEAHPLLSPSDEFADYETRDGWYRSTAKDRASAAWKQRKRSEYARSSLKLGLSQQAKVGVNPFKFGMIGSTDAHTSLAAIDENNYWGKVSLHEPSVYRLTDPLPKEEYEFWELAASGYAGVWAEENTRESLFAAMKRKEVYATTGPRMTVRFFGGWDYQTEDAFTPDLGAIGYRKGVPMGGDLTQVAKGKKPTFLIRAVKDPDGANLDRVQVIKGWRDSEGGLHEKIYNVALSDGRKENWRGKVKPVGSTVDIKAASYTNTIGDPELALVWTDPDFNQDELAFYYVRVLEIPTPRWTAYDAKFFGLKDLPEDIPMVTQERAYTSPIWYSP